MVPLGWRMWFLIVQFAAFIATAGLMALLIAPVLQGWEIYPAVLLVLVVIGVPFGLLPYAIAHRLGLVAWRHAVQAGLWAGGVFGLISILIGISARYRTLAISAEMIGDGLLLMLLPCSIGVIAGLAMRALVPADILHRSAAFRRPQWRDALPLGLAVAAIALVPICDWAR